MSSRVPILLLILTGFTHSAGAQQKPGGPWDVIGGYVCSTPDGGSDKLYLLPDMTWSTNPPFTPFASKGSPNHLWRIPHEPALADGMQAEVFIVSIRGRLQIVGWKPRPFRYEGSMLRLYFMEGPGGYNPLLLEPARVPMLLFFRQFKFDTASQELREIRSTEDSQPPFLCRKDSLF